MILTLVERSVGDIAGLGHIKTRVHSVLHSAFTELLLR